MPQTSIFYIKCLIYNKYKNLPINNQSTSVPWLGSNSCVFWVCRLHLGIKDILASKLDYWECTRLGAAPRDWYFMDYTFFDLERTPSEGKEVWWQFQQGKHYIPHCQHVQLLCLPLCLSHTSWLQSEWSSSAAWLPAIRNQLFMYNPLWIVLSKDNLCAFISCHFCVSACSWVSSSYKWGKSFQCGQILGVGWRCQHLNWVPRQVYLWLFNSMTYDPTFLHRDFVQWNEHPLSCTSGRFWQRALQTAFLKSSITLVTLSGWGRMDVMASRTAL